MLAFIENGQWIEWAGQPRPLNGGNEYQLPRNAEDVFSESDLADYSLSKVEPCVVPDGKVMKSYSIQDVDGAPVQVGVFDDIPEPPFSDLPRPAFLFMMNKIGVTEQQVELLISAMPDGTQDEADAKALALIVFRNQQTFKRDNQLLATLANSAGISGGTIDAAWRVAEQLTW